MKDHVREYYFRNQTRLEQMRRDAIASIPCQRPLHKMFMTCECGATIGVKNIIQHYMSSKHRSVCGDIHPMVGTIIGEN
jgi:hypothetical protein